VVANAFSIREVDLSDPHSFLGSPNMHFIAKAHGLWDGRGRLDFTRTYSDGEYLHKYYSGRRVWGAYAMLAPSAHLPVEYGEWRESRPYPATLRPDRKVTVTEFQKVMRSYYEGTAYDQTRGLAAGPWGTPDHAMAGGSQGKKGNWERTIALWRTSDSHLVQARADVPAEVRGVLWWGAHTAATTIYVPVFSGATKLPGLLLGHYEALDKGTLFWACRYLFNTVQLKYSRMIGPVRALQGRLEATLGQQLVDQTTAAVEAAEPSERGAIAAQMGATHAEQVLRELWALFDHLMFTYGDGFIARTAADGAYEAVADPYPDWWLDAVNYSQGPPPCAGAGV
jgi:dipeptidase